MGSRVLIDMRTNFIHNPQHNLRPAGSEPTGRRGTMLPWTAPIFCRLGLERVVTTKLRCFRPWAECKQWLPVAGCGV
jgi:hypothetical protein